MSYVIRSSVSYLMGGGASGQTLIETPRILLTRKRATTSSPPPETTGVDAERRKQAMVQCQVLPVKREAGTQFPNET